MAMRGRDQFLVCLTLLGVAFGAAAQSTVTLEVIKGSCYLQRANANSWEQVETKTALLHAGDRVRTASRAQAKLALQDGSTIELGPASVFLVDFLSESRFNFKLSFGRLKAWVKRAASRQLSVLTPTAVCAVRGTEFFIAVDRESGQTSAELYKGLLAVSDSKGNEAMLNPNERIEVSVEGLGNKMTIEEGRRQAQATMQNQGKDEARREVGLSMSKEQVQAAAAQEMKLAEYQQGKSLIDVFGNRVRLEQYIMRPAEDKFKLVVLNERQDRFDYFYYLGTFNKTLPNDLSVALTQMSGGLTQPEYYLAAYETGRSNLTDVIQENASGGHLVDVNNNTPSSDNVSLVLDPVTDQFRSLNQGESYWKTLFDNYAISFNGRTLLSWAPSQGPNIQAMNDVKYSYDGGSYDVVSDFPSSGLFHNRIRESYGSGVTAQWDSYIVSNEGEVAAVSDFGGVTTGTQYKGILLKWNYEQVITSSLFEGRKIDLVVEPKTLIQSGIIP